MRQGHQQRQQRQRDYSIYAVTINFNICIIRSSFLAIAAFTDEILAILSCI